MREGVKVEEVEKTPHENIPRVLRSLCLLGMYQYWRNILIVNEFMYGYQTIPPNTANFKRLPQK